MPSFRNAVVYIINVKTFLKNNFSLLVYIILKNNFLYVPLHSCDYLCDISIKIDVATDEGSVRNEI